MKFIRITQIIFMCFCLSLSPLFVSAHGHGRHHNSSHSSSSGSYHYDHGMGPHLHKNGVCPYSGTKKIQSTIILLPYEKYSANLISSATNAVRQTDIAVQKQNVQSESISAKNVLL